MLTRILAAVVWLLWFAAIAVGLLSLVWLIDAIQIVTTSKPLPHRWTTSDAQVYLVQTALSFVVSAVSMFGFWRAALWMSRPETDLKLAATRLWRRILRWPLIVPILSSVLASMIAMADLPYGAYLLTRTAMCAACAYSAWWVSQLGRTGILWVLGTLAVLYNPVIPVRLGNSELWGLLNGFTVVILVFVATRYRASLERATSLSLPREPTSRD